MYEYVWYIYLRLPLKKSTIHVANIPSFLLSTPHCCSHPNPNPPSQDSAFLATLATLVAGECVSHRFTILSHWLTSKLFGNFIFPRLPNTKGFWRYDWTPKTIPSKHRTSGGFISWSEMAGSENVKAKCLRVFDVFGWGSCPLSVGGFLSSLFCDV